jgi:hypothetical protein
MNRRRFLTTLFGLAAAPVIVARVLSAPPKPTLLAFKGTRFMETGYVYAPYIPMLITPMIDIKPMRNSPLGKVFYMNKYYTKHTTL